MRLTELLSAYPEIVKIDENNYECKICFSRLKYTQRQGTKQISRHITNSSHLRRKSLANTNADEDAVDFHREFVKMILKCGLPLNLINNALFRDFIEKYTKQKLMSKTYYHKKTIPELHKSEYAKTLNELKGKMFGLMVDESPDFMGRKIVNIMVFKLSDEFSKPILINTIEVDTTKSEVLAQIIIFEAQKFIIAANDFKNFRLLVTDGAAYCIKLGKIIKSIVPSLLHVTCLAHNLHNLSEKIRGMCPEIDILNVLLIKIFKYSKQRRKELKLDKNITVRKFPVITRWGTWLRFTKLIFENFVELEDFIMKQSDGVYDKVKLQIKNIKIDEEYNFLTRLFCISDKIKQLETQGLTIYEQVSVINQVKGAVAGTVLETEYKRILDRNPDLNYFLCYSGLRCEENDKCLNFAPLTSVDVERSFSKLKYFLGDKKTKMKVENLQCYLYFYFNK